MIYVVVQFGCIVYLIFNAQFAHFNALTYLLISIATVIGLSAVINMKPSNLNISPALKKQHQLVTNGIYHWIRHPMYTSVLLLCLAFSLTNMHYLAQLTLLVLWIDLILKSNLEEKLLTQRFDTYQDYKNKTGRFIPYLCKGPY
ncbi:MAG: isoprenylcysteine carboxylmethyltransferase family protein [Gammaproteobacteria bacterium]|nr:isoprenylcysteine carboxylmethyltransferase family protein [Gammaproteobacteria bacterium]